MGKRYKKQSNHHPSAKKISQVTSSNRNVFEDLTEDELFAVRTALQDAVKKYGAITNGFLVILIFVYLSVFMARYIADFFYDQQYVDNDATLKDYLSRLFISLMVIISGFFVGNRFLSVINSLYPVGIYSKCDLTDLNASTEISLEEGLQSIKRLDSQLSEIKSWLNASNLTKQAVILNFFSYMIMPFLSPAYRGVLVAMPFLSVVDIFYFYQLVENLSDQVVEDFCDNLAIVTRNLRPAVWARHDFGERFPVARLKLQSDNCCLEREDFWYTVKRSGLSMSTQLLSAELSNVLIDCGLNVFYGGDSRLLVLPTVDFDVENAKLARKKFAQIVFIRSYAAEIAKIPKKQLNEMTNNIYAAKWELHYLDSKVWLKKLKTKEDFPGLFLRLDISSLKKPLQEILIKGLKNIYGEHFQWGDDCLKVPVLKNKLEIEKVAFETLKKEIDEWLAKDSESSTKSLSVRVKGTKLSQNIEPLFANPYPYPYQRIAPKSWFSNFFARNKAENNASDANGDKEDLLIIFPETGVEYPADLDKVPVYKVKTPGFSAIVLLRFMVVENMFNKISEKSGKDAMSIYLELLVDGVFFVSPKGQEGLVRLDEKSADKTGCQYKLKHPGLNARIAIKEVEQVELPDGSKATLLQTEKVYEHRKKR